MHAVPVSDRSVVANHRRLIEATWGVLRPGAAISHFSAAVLHGLPVPTGRLDRVWITRPGRSGKIEHQLHLCRAALISVELTTIDQTSVTSLARTAVDTTRRMDFDAGVVLMDAAQRAGAAPQLVADTLVAGARRRGNARSRAVADFADFADGRAESPGESLSRVLMSRHGVPIPELQLPVHDADGLIGRCDFGWPGAAGDR